MPTCTTASPCSAGSTDGSPRPFSLAGLFESPPSAHRMLALEGMRGGATLLVFFVHFNALMGFYTRPDSFLNAATRFGGAVGNVGVDIFFVVSGFLMYGIVLRRPTPFLTYLRRRARRLYPVFLFVFAVYVGVSLASPGESRIPQSTTAAAQYLLVNLAMLPGILPIAPLITVAWSLSYEWFYYLILPLSMWVLGLRRWSPRWRIAFLLSLCVVQYILSSLHWSSHPRLIMFGCGACLWELATGFGITRHLGRCGERLTIGLVIFALAWVGISAKYHLAAALNQAGIHAAHAPLLFVTFLLLTLYSLFFEGMLNRFFSVKWLRWMGNISYSYYLTHGLTLHFVARLMRHGFGNRPLPVLGFLAAGAGALLVTIVVGALVFLVIEKPLSLSSSKPALAQWPRFSLSFRLRAAGTE